MSQIHITNSQSGQILDVITAKHILFNKHRKSLKDNLETFEFITFADRSFSEHLGKMNRVVIPDEDGTFIELVINEAIKYRSKLDRTLKAEVYASASYLLLKKAKVIRPQILESQTTETLVNYSLAGTKWLPGNITFAGIRTIHIEEHTNPFSLLKRVAREFGLELRFRVEVDG
ncbi:phage tail spike protein, partial [Sutcliffiella cohnii]